MSIYSSSRFRVRYTGSMKRQIPDSARATLADVCKAAGVSSATVSRVVNGSPLVVGATKRKVMGAIARLGYQPSQAARALRSNRADAIAVLSPVPAHESLSELLVTIEAELGRRGKLLCLSFYRTTPQFEAILQGLALSRRVDGGLIVLPSDAVVRAAARQGHLALPVSVVGRTVPVSRLKVTTIAALLELLSRIDSNRSA